MPQPGIEDMSQNSIFYLRQIDTTVLRIITSQLTINQHNGQSTRKKNIIPSLATEIRGYYY